MSTYSSLPSMSRTHGWVERISKIFTREVAILIDHLPPVSVFEIPRTVSDQKPEAYSPQLIALGPYHHLRPELYQMERYKLTAVKQIVASPEQIFSFEDLVIHRLKEIDPTTRACYNKFMDYDRDTLAWIMAIDGCFILNLLRSDDHQHVMDNTIITRDIMMLENQIPYVHLKEIRRCLGLSSCEVDQDRVLFYMMLDFCEGQSPVTFTVDRSRCNTNRRPHHLLDLMYYLIVNGPSCLFDADIEQDSYLVQQFRDNDLIRSSSSSSASSVSSLSDKEEEDEVEQERIQELNSVKKNVETVLELVESFGLGNKRAQSILKPVKVASNIPWSSVSGLFRKGSHQTQGNNEIPIPSVSQLWKHASVECVPNRAGINEIRFEENEARLYLPVLNLNASSEVILRNLVAYEATMSYSSLEFARYVNLMNGIVDTAEDVKLLRRNGVVKGALTDEEVAEIFNGMKRSYVRVGERSNVEIAIEKVNKYYNDQLSVRIIGWAKRKLYASWKNLAIFSTVMLFLLVSVQSFCDVYGCHRFWDGK